MAKLTKSSLHNNEFGFVMFGHGQGYLEQNLFSNNSAGFLFVLTCQGVIRENIFDEHRQSVEGAGLSSLCEVFFENISPIKQFRRGTFHGKPW